jgi:hypothetical protein
VDYTKAKDAMAKANKLVDQAANLEAQNQKELAKAISAKKSAHEVAW